MCRNETLFLQDGCFARGIKKDLLGGSVSNFSDTFTLAASSLAQDTSEDILEPSSQLPSLFSPRLILPVSPNSLPPVWLTATTLPSPPQELRVGLWVAFVTVYFKLTFMEFNLQRGTMGTFHHTEWYEKPQTLWMGSEIGNKINKLVSQSDPEYRWQEQWWATLHFSTFSSFSQSLISASLLFIVSQGTCSLLTRTCLNIQRYDPQTEWGLLKEEGGASACVCCPPIEQACRWFA